MKKLFFTALIFCFHFGYGQSKKDIPTLLKISPIVTGKTTKTLSDRGKNLYNNIRKHRFTKECRNIAIIDIAKLSNEKNNGYFKFEIPRSRKGNEMRSILSIPKEIEAEENGDYYYHGDLVAGKNGRGSIFLHYKDGKHFGSMHLNRRFFDIVYLGKGELMLVEKKKMRPKACPVDKLKKSPSTAKALEPSLSNKAGCSKKVRVLVLYTDKANTISNPSQVAVTGIGTLNSTLYNSRVYRPDLSFELAGVRRLSSFKEGSDPVDDLRKFVGFNDAKVLRNKYRADLVVLLTNGAYGGTQGIATLRQFGYANTGFAALVEANGGWVIFPHEVGHLLGCKHDSDPQTTNNLKAWARGHNWYYNKGIFKKRRYQKSLVAGGPAKGYFVATFSNPGVKFEDRSVGNTGSSSRNNARQLKSAACRVSNYIASEPAPAMAVSINGPYNISLYRSFTLSANVRNCSSRTYKWETSNDGFRYYSTGTGSKMTTRVYSGDRFYVRLTVRCSDGQIRTAHRTFYISNDQMRKGAEKTAKSGLPSDGEGKKIVSGNSIINYPNPASDVILLSSRFEAPKNVDIYLYDILNMGERKKLYSGPLGHIDELRLNIAKFDQGLYELIIFEEGKIIFQKRQLISRW